MEQEIWKDVVGYEGLYQISSLARVKSLKYKRGAILKPGTGTNGYKYVSLTLDGEVKNHKVHRLVALAFIDNPKRKLCVNHLDGNKANNELKNLEWCTHTENMIHAYSIGLSKSTDFHKRKVCEAHRGEGATFAKMSEEKIREAFRLSKSGVPRKDICKLFGIKQPALSNILTRKAWKHVDVSTI